MTTLTEPYQSFTLDSLALRIQRTAQRSTIDTPCQLCGAIGVERLLDLGPAPLVACVGDAGPEDDEARQELRLVRCTTCGTLQLDDTLDTDARHSIATAVTDRSLAGRPDLARRFCEDAIDRWDLRGRGHIVEVGSGTGSLLRFFRAWQLPVVGIEPDQRLTRYARLRRIPTWRATFDAAIAGRLARAEMRADLLIVSTPTGAFDDLREMLAAAVTILRTGGVMTMEVPDVLRLIEGTRFDDLCHANRVIPSIGQLRRVANTFGLDVVDVEHSEVIGDRLRVWLRRSPRDDADGDHPRLQARLEAESAAEVHTPHAVAAFARRAQLVREQILSLIGDCRRQDRTVAVYGSSVTAVALANAVGLTRPDVAYVVDDVNGQCGTTLPGTNIPIISRDQAADWRPDVVLALDDLPDASPGWEGVPVYAVTDLIDVVHRLTTAGHAAGVRADRVRELSRSGSPRR